jgi:hypothetical protein
VQPTATQPRTNGDRLADFDFESHNEEVRALWPSLDEGRPIRTPIFFGINTRYFVLSPEANPQGVDFEDYFNDPDLMFDSLLRFQRWSRFNILQDTELGLPETWGIAPEFQNVYDAAWFGCPIVYREWQVPDSEPVFASNPEALLDRGMPDPFGGLFGQALEYYEHFLERARNEEYLGRPIQVNLPWGGLSCDGIMTIACSVFGPDFVCTAMASEPERLRRLLDFMTDALLARLQAWGERFGVPFPRDKFGFGDDSIALISTKMYREHILPHHKKMHDACSTDRWRWMHLCGDASRQFRTLVDELNIRHFDTGFPIDLGRVRQELGPEIRLDGGPHIEMLHFGTPAEIEAEVERICGSGVLQGGLFCLREANNLAPGTPLENMEALYHAGRRFGYRRSDA